MPTIKEVAKKAHVSVGTVSNVLSGTVPVSKRLKERVLEVIRELDYHPNYVARSLKIRHTKLIGLMVRDIGSPIVPQLLRGAEQSAERAGYMLVTCHSDDRSEREQELLGDLRRRCVDGILLVAAGSDHAHVWAVRESGIPVVCLERELPGFDSVVADRFNGVRECVGHLISRGHRSIGLLTENSSGELEREFALGYRRALEDAGISYDESLIASGERSAWFDLLAGQRRPSAILTANAMLALGLLAGLKDLGLTCPDQIAVATFDDPAFAGALRPSLTAVAQPSFEIGERGMDLLLKRIAEPERDHTKVVLETRLMIRESSGSQTAAAER